jgi:hypothetical protein
MPAALPADEGRPPFLVVIDVGNVIELYAEFTCTGGSYTPFPDPRSHRIRLDDLARPEIRARLKAVWNDPHSLDPARRTARVTREIAGRLARVAQSLEANYAPRARRHLPLALPVLDVRRRRRPAAQGRQRRRLHRPAQILPPPLARRERGRG